MEKQQYLPHEVVNYTNFPVLRERRVDLERIQTYAMRVYAAVQDYESGKYDKIDLNAQELADHIQLCRNVSRAIGTAERVCFDVLVELRNIQKAMQSVLYLKNRYGDRYVGTPTASEGGSI